MAIQNFSSDCNCFKSSSETVQELKLAMDEMLSTVAEKEGQKGAGLL